MTAPTVAPDTAQRRPIRRRPSRVDPGVRAARRRFLRVLTIVGLWFWAFWVLLVVGVLLVVEQWGGEAVGFTYDVSGSPARWIPFVVGIVVTAGALPVHVGAGGTRRAWVDGATRAAVVVGLAFGVLTVVLVLVEQQIYAEGDRPWQVDTGTVALDTAGGIAVAVAAESLVMVTYLLVAVAIASGFRRFGPWRGTLLVAPLLLPCALVDIATRTGIAGIPWRGGYDDVALGALFGVGGALVVAALAYAVAHLVLRSAPLRP
ncbi:hypothetical protein [Isoptericola haloaureus]|uniref:Uncharacterized protein n=1 Tax=Isoptericola haloaureus TaxID=1542902 RepID=A0ABU7Z5I7_9MICO